MADYEIVSGKLPDGTIFARAETEIPFPKTRDALVELGKEYYRRSFDHIMLGKPMLPLSNKTMMDLEVASIRESERTPVVPRPTRILLSGNRTIVFWHDGTKTIVKQSPTEQYSVYAAFTAALAIKLYGSNSKLKKMIRDNVEVQKTKEPKPEPPKEEEPKPFRPGCKVRMKDNILHEANPVFYPPMGTIGTILEGCKVQWPIGSTSSDDIWWCCEDALEVVED